MPEIHLCGVNVPDYQGSPPVPGLLPSHCTLPTRAHILNSLSTFLGEQGSTSCGKRASGLRPPSLSLYLFLSLLSLSVPHLSQNIRTRKPRKMCCPVREIRNSKKKAKEQTSQRKHEKNGECNKHTRKLSPILHSLVHHIDFAANHCIPEDLSDSDL